MEDLEKNESHWRKIIVFKIMERKKESTPM
jgi:hypothetical protein